MVTERGRLCIPKIAELVYRLQIQTRKLAFSSVTCQNAPSAEPRGASKEISLSALISRQTVDVPSISRRQLQGNLERKASAVQHYTVHSFKVTRFLVRDERLTRKQMHTCYNAHCTCVLNNSQTTQMCLSLGEATFLGHISM